MREVKSSDFVAIGEAKFYYQLAGDGPALVLVHAGIADSRMWDEQFDVFAQSNRVLRYDRRGFGRTEMVAGEFSHHSDLQQLLNLLAIERAVLVGCSQGAKTCLDFALTYPDMCAALVLVSPAVSGFVFEGKMPRQADEIELAEAAGDLDRVNELELQIWVDGPLRRPEQVDPGLRERVREMNGIALRTPEDLGTEQALQPAAVDRLGEIKLPVLVITGNLDTPRTLAAADLLVGSIPGAQWAVMTGTAHLPNMEKPDEFNAIGLSFLKTIGWTP